MTTIHFKEKRPAHLYLKYLITQVSKSRRARRKLAVMMNFSVTMIIAITTSICYNLYKTPNRNEVNNRMNSCSSIIGTKIVSSFLDGIRNFFGYQVDVPWQVIFVFIF